LRLPYDLARDLPRILDESGFSIVGLELEDVAAARQLERLHGDPFDRIQMIQAKRRNWTLISPDPVFEQYRIDRVW